MVITTDEISRFSTCQDANQPTSNDVFRGERRKEEKKQEKKKQMAEGLRCIPGKAPQNVSGILGREGAHDETVQWNE